MSGLRSLTYGCVLFSVGLPPVIEFFALLGIKPPHPA
jgi:hypothetical protein